MRLGNADVGLGAADGRGRALLDRVGLWSLVSGPVDVRSLELGDVSVLLEKGKDGKGNWVFGEGTKPEEGRAMRTRSTRA